MNTAVSARLLLQESPGSTVSDVDEHIGATRLQTQSINFMVLSGCLGTCQLVPAGCHSKLHTTVLTSEWPAQPATSRSYL